MKELFDAINVMKARSNPENWDDVLRVQRAADALQQQLAAAREECERLRQAVMYQEGMASEFVVRAAAAEADAARYRWLREARYNRWSLVKDWCEKELDDAVDSAIATLQRDRQP